MTFPRLGTLSHDDSLNCYTSDPVPVPVLGNHPCTFTLDGYADDAAPADFHAAVGHFLDAAPAVLAAAAADVFAYCQDCADWWDDADGPPPRSPGDVWRHVRLGTEPHVSRRRGGDRGVYVSVECNCDWEPEHGLQIVFRNGQRVNKVGPFDGHVTNADAYGNGGLADVVYRRRR